MHARNENSNESPSLLRSRVSVDWSHRTSVTSLASRLPQPRCPSAFGASSWPTGPLARLRQRYAVGPMIKEANQPTVEEQCALAFLWLEVGVLSPSLPAGSCKVAAPRCWDPCAPEASLLLAFQIHPLGHGLAETHLARSVGLPPASTWWDARAPHLLSALHSPPSRGSTAPAAPSAPQPFIPLTLLSVCTNHCCYGPGQVQGRKASPREHGSETHSYPCLRHPHRSSGA